MRKILYISGTRADYGLMKSVLHSINNHPDLELEIVATGMHIMPEFGNTIEEIEKSGFKVHKINVVYEKDDKESMALFLGKFVQELTHKVKEIRPDIILLLGDRAEMLGGAIVGAYLSIPTAHIHGGDVTSTIDNVARQAITKLANIHFPATEESAKRIRKMGEEKWRIHVVGAPGLDCINNFKPISKKDLFCKLGLNDEKTILVIQHSVTMEMGSAEKQIKETLNVIKELNYQCVIIYPNADAGGRKMISIIEKYQKEPKFRIFKNLAHNDYINLLSYIEVMVGNSSSGIIEAASFKLPVVNIGTRQRGREKSINVIDVGYNKEDIKKSIQKALSPEFKNSLNNCINLYGNGKSGEEILNQLTSIELSDKLLQK